MLFLSLAQNANIYQAPCRGWLCRTNRLPRQCGHKIRHQNCQKRHLQVTVK